MKTYCTENDTASVTYTNFHVLVGSVKNLNEDDFKTLKKEFFDKWQYLIKNLAYPYEHVISIDDFKRPVDNLKKEDFFSELKNKCLGDDELQRTKEIFKKLILKMGRINKIKHKK